MLNLPWKGNTFNKIVKRLLHKVACTLAEWLHYTHPFPQFIFTVSTNNINNRSSYDWCIRMYSQIPGSNAKHGKHSWFGTHGIVQWGVSCYHCVVWRGAEWISDTWVWDFFFFSRCVLGQSLRICSAYRARCLVFIHPPLHRAPLLPSAAGLCAGWAGRELPSGCRAVCSPGTWPWPRLPLRAGTLRRDFSSCSLKYETLLWFLNGVLSWQRIRAQAVLILGGEAWSFMCAEFLGLFWESFLGK